MEPEVIPPAAPAPAPAAVVPPVTPPADPAPAPAQASPPAAPAVPEKYDLKVPDGFDDPKVVDRVAEFAKANKMSQESAQQLLEKTVGEVNSYGDRVRAEIDSTVSGWEQAAKADKEIGGDNHTKSIELSKKVLAKFGSPELVKYLEDTRLGNNPELIRVFKRIGEAMKEDDFVAPGSSNNGTTSSAADKLYDNPSSKTS